MGIRLHPGKKGFCESLDETVFKRCNEFVKEAYHENKREHYICRGK